MEAFFTTITETQNNSLEAATSFTNSCLIVVERITQLNIEVTRITFEQSAEMALLCLEYSLSKVRQ
jgi:hypothetical protein